MIKEIREGIEGTDIKAGIIGEIGLFHCPISPFLLTFPPHNPRVVVAHNRRGGKGVACWRSSILENRYLVSQWRSLTR